MRRFVTCAALAGAVAFAGCAEDQNPVVAPGATVADVDITAAKGGKNLAPAATDPALRQAIESRLTALVREKGAVFDAERAAAGVELEGVATAVIGYHWTGHLDGQRIGAEVIFDDRGNKQLGPQWVPGDPRRLGRTDIGYAVLSSAPAGLTPTEVDAAIDRAMDTWESQRCSAGLVIPKGTFLDWLFFQSDVLHAGFLDLGDPFVLGVTSIAIFVDPVTDEPTDIDGDGHPDYAFAVIFYNSAAFFPWTIDGNLDVETIALHEAGHGLAQAHFGKAFETLANGRIHFAPRAVMNAGYSGVQQSLTGTDRAGHCTMYGQWPNN